MPASNTSMTINESANPDLLARIRAEAKIARRHMGPQQYADELQVTVPKLRELENVAGTTQVVPWSKLSEPVLRSMFDAYIEGREVASRFCSRHGYSVGGFSKAMQEMWPDEWSVTQEEKRPEARNLYRMGRSLEHRTRLRLMAAGWVVVRSAGSKTAADLVAMKDGVTWLVQCKRAGALPPSEWNELLSMAEQAGGVPVMVENPHSGTVRWWQLLTPKQGRGTGDKEPIPAPVPQRGADMFQLEQKLETAEADEIEPAQD